MDTIISSDELHVLIAERLEEAGATVSELKHIMKKCAKVSDRELADVFARFCGGSGAAENEDVIGLLYSLTDLQVLTIGARLDASRGWD